MGLADSERIDRITLHPDNSDIAYVAALGTLWGPNEERGVYKTVDGGGSPLHADPETPADQGSLPAAVRPAFRPKNVASATEVPLQ